MCRREFHGLGIDRLLGLNESAETFFFALHVLLVSLFNTDRLFFIFLAILLKLHYMRDSRTSAEVQGKQGVHPDTVVV